MQIEKDERPLDAVSDVGELNTRVSNAGAAPAHQNGRHRTLLRSNLDVFTYTHTHTQLSISRGLDLDSHFEYTRMSPVGTFQRFLYFVGRTI